MIKLTAQDAEKYRQIIELAAQSLTDEQALQAPMLFEHWQSDTAYEVGQRIYYNGTLYSVLIAHTSQADWTPDISPSLFAKVLIPNPEVIPDWEQPDSTNGYMKGDKVNYNGVIYESIIDNNIWSPAAYPAGWQEVN